MVKLLNNKSASLGRQVAKSIVIHGLVIAAGLVTVHRVRQQKPYRLPGTAQGLHMLTYYSGGSKIASNASLAKRNGTSSEHTARSSTPQKLKETPAAPTRAEHGIGNSPTSGLGNGNINIATPKYFPYPEVPLPHGTNGNIVLDAVIDDHGAITSLTVEKSITPEIDAAVAAIVKTWTFQPATQGGVAVASEQSIIFHYERA